MNAYVQFEIHCLCLPETMAWKQGQTWNDCMGSYSSRYVQTADKALLPRDPGMCPSLVHRRTEFWMMTCFDTVSDAYVARLRWSSDDIVLL